MFSTISNAVGTFFDGVKSKGQFAIKCANLFNESKPLINKIHNLLNEYNDPIQNEIHKEPESLITEKKEKMENIINDWNELNKNTKNGKDFNETNINSFEKVLDQLKKLSELLSSNLPAENKKTANSTDDFLLMTLKVITGIGTLLGAFFCIKNLFNKTDSKPEQSTIPSLSMK